MKRTLLFAVVALISLTSMRESRAFFEERVNYGDRPVSTIHFYLIRAMSRCVGFDAVESDTIAAWSQIVDSGTLESPTLGHLEQHFSLRGGPNDPFFHWPRQQELTVMKNWVMGRGPLFECVDDDCSDIRIIHTGLKPLSHESFGVYLHSLADSFSHSDCMETGKRQHTSDPMECELDEHFTEFGPEAADHTFGGIKAVLDELVWWSAYNHTFSRILPSAMEETIYRFVTEADYWDPTDRVRIADDLYARCAAQDERGDLGF